MKFESCVKREYEKILNSPPFIGGRKWNHEIMLCLPLILSRYFFKHEIENIFLGIE